MENKKLLVINIFWKIMYLCFFGVVVYCITGISEISEPKYTPKQSKKDKEVLTVIHYKGRTLSDYMWKEMYDK